MINADSGKQEKIYSNLSQMVTYNSAFCLDFRAKNFIIGNVKGELESYSMLNGRLSIELNRQYSEISFIELD